MREELKNAREQIERDRGTNSYQLLSEHLQEENASLHQEIIKLQNSLKEKDDRVNLHKDVLASLKKEKEDAQEKAKSATDKFDTLERELREAKQKVADGEEHTRIYKDLRESSTSEIQALKSKLEAAQSANKKLLDDLEVIKQKKVEMDEQDSMRKQVIETLRKDNAELRNTSAKVESQWKESESLRKKAEEERDLYKQLAESQKALSASTIPKNNVAPSAVPQANVAPQVNVVFKVSNISGNAPFAQSDVIGFEAENVDTINAKTMFNA